MKERSSTSLAGSHAIRKQLRIYFIVGAVLFAGTLATVAVATVPWLDIGDHGFDRWDMALGLLIAAFKASLVAAIFMHLNHERRMIYFISTFAVLHCAGMMLLLALAEADRVHNPLFYQGSRLTDPGGVSVARGPFPQTEETKKDISGPRR